VSHEPGWQLVISYISQTIGIDNQNLVVTDEKLPVKQSKYVLKAENLNKVV